MNGSILQSIRLRILAILLVTAGVAEAQSASEVLSVSPTNRGEAIYVPYFSVRSGRSTLLSVSNENPRLARAVRVVFSRHSDGRSIYEADLFLRAGESWNGAITPSGSTSDDAWQASIVPVRGERACLVPRLVGSTTPASTQAREESKEGAIEIIELGQLDAKATAVLETGDCAALKDMAPSSLLPPDESISAAAELVDAGQGFMWSIEGIALSGFSRAQRLGEENLRITDPQPGDDGKLHVAIVQHGRVLEAEVDRPVDAASAVFASRQLAGDYALSFDGSASAEWVISFPTRHAYASDNGASPSPFSGECEALAITVVGRDGQGLAPPFRDTVEELHVCDQVSHFTLRRPVTFIPEAGEGRVFIASGERAPLPGTQLVGLPAVGITLQRIAFDPLIKGQPPRVFTSSRPMRSLPAAEVTFPLQ